MNDDEPWTAQRDEGRTRLRRRYGNADRTGRCATKLVANLACRAKQPRQAADVKHHQWSHDFEARREILGDLY